MIDGHILLIFLGLGGVVGFVAGLLGVGGGGIMVPVLTSIFIAQQVPLDNVVHLALGTSMAAIIVTSLSSMRAHHKNGAVDWQTAKYLAIGVLAGTYLATYLVAILNTQILAVIFAAFMGYTALKMFLSKTTGNSTSPPNKGALVAAGGGIGAISALVSIGGGSLTVPYLNRRGFDLKIAIGTSAALGLPIALTGTIGFAINGIAATDWQSGQLGFVNLPAVVAISITSAIFAPLGAKVSHRLPVAVLKKLFGVLLVGLSAKMLMSVL